VSTTIEEVLGEATILEKEYEWLQASELYEQALNMVNERDYFRRGEVQEKIGYSLHRATFQAESREEFLERLRRAVEAYKKAHGFYDKLEDEKKVAWMLRCDAISRYLEHWMDLDSSEKRRLLGECLELEGGSLESFWDQGEKLEYGRTYNKLASASVLRAQREWDREARMDVLKNGISWGGKAVEVLSELDDPHVIARAHFAHAWNLWVNSYLYEPKPEKRQQNRVEYIERFKKAADIAEGVGDAYTAGLSHVASEKYDKALVCGEKTKDIYLKSWALGDLAYDTYFKAHSIEDPDHRLRLAEKAMGYYDEAQHFNSIMSYQVVQTGKLAAPAPGGYAEYYWDRARWEVTLDNKLELLEKSEKAGSEALKAAEAIDLPFIVNRMHHVLSGALTYRASLEQEVNTKRGLLEKAMEHREKNIEIFEGLAPYHYWNRGVYQYLLGNIKVELAHLQQDLDGKGMMLEDAASTLETSLKTMIKDKPYQQTVYYASLSRYQEAYGSILTRLYKLTKDPEHLRKAIETWRMAIESAREVDMTARIAESYWSIAKAQDVLGERTEAAESFMKASENYLKTAEKIPQLKEFYQEHASYMRAWNEIERAKHHHAEKQYGEARKHYEKASELHKSTERWSYLAPNYQAWAMLEEAEDLSREEQTEEAQENFEMAASLFLEAKNSIQTNLNRIEGEEEKEIAEKLVKASGVRREYCLGRVSLEDARVLDRQGDHSASSKRYGQAVEKFQGVMDSLERESDQKELRPIINLCKAWEKMMMAEAQMSPSLYDEAASLFIEARDNSSDQTTRLLAQAHSSFCKALEAGTMFELTRGTDLFSEAKRHIEASTSYYLRAGHQTMSDYAGATSRFLDAYLYTYNAQTEADPKKRAQFYQMAERLLQSSAGAYLKAKHPEKSDEIRRILRRVKEEREIAVSLSEVLHTPSLVSTTASFSTPTPTHEQAVGLERFESADIQANLIAKRREVGVGEDMDLEIELVNAGKAPAQLIKVEEIIPEGFEVISAPDICRVEDSYLDMKGRTLNPLKTAELKIILKPLDKGTYELRPRVLYLDEAGKYRSHEPEPATVVVKELGIKGWIRGPTR